MHEIEVDGVRRSRAWDAVSALAVLSGLLASLAKLWRRFEAVPSYRASVIVGLLAWLGTTFLYAPPVWMPILGGGPSPARIDHFLRLCSNPFARDLGEPLLAYRITTPALAWLLGLRGPSSLVLQYAAIPGTLAVIFLAVEERSTRLLACLMSAGVAVTYTIIWTNAAPGFVDSVTHLCAALLLCTTQLWAWVLLIVAGTLNDERMVLALPFLILWHARRGSFVALVRESWRLVAACVAAIVIVFVVRHALTVGWLGPGIERPKVYDRIADKALVEPFLGWSNYAINVPLGFRTLWVLPVLWLVQALNGPRKFYATAYLLGILLLCLGAALVADIARSIGFGFPALLVAAVGLYEHNRTRAVVIAAVAVGVAVVLPAFYYPGQVQWHRPLVLALIRRWTGWDVLQAL